MRPAPRRGRRSRRCATRGYRARDLVSGKTVALKVLESTGERERFLREASLLARLRHPAIVAHVASGEAADGQFYLAMEWLEGEDLAERLARKSLSAGESL